MARVFLISYDLRKPGRDYTTLIDKMNQLGAVKPLKSDWLLKVDGTAAQVRDALASLTDANDGLLVVALTGEAAWRNVACSDAVMKSKLAA